MRATWIVAVWAVGVLSACVEPPFAHTNPTDSQTKVHLALYDIPDTLYAVGDTFTARFEMSPTLPTTFPALQWSVSSGSILHASNGHFRVLAGAGLLPTTVKISLLVPRMRRNPNLGSWSWIDAPHSVDTSIVVRQRPVIARVLCPATTGCILNSWGAPKTYSFYLLDARGAEVRLPSNPYRFGTVVSRDTTAVLVEARGTPSTFSLVRMSVGDVWIVLSGEGVKDSILVTW